MSVWSRVSSMLPVPATWDNLLRQSYDCDKPTHLNEMNYPCYGDAPVVRPPPLSVFEYLERYLTFFDVGRFSRLQTDFISWQVQAHLAKRMLYDCR